MRTAATVTPHEIEVPVDEIKAILEQAKEGPLSEEDRELLLELAVSYCALLGELKDGKASIRRLRQLVFGVTTESKDKLLGRPDAGDSADETQASKQKKKGHGRIPAEDYTGAERVTVPHESLSAGDACPLGCDRTLHAKKPRRLVRIKGCAPLAATLYEQERLRCNSCGESFTARAPEGIGEKELDETAASMVALLRYGSGFPMNRIAGLQQALGVPVPVSTQWELVRDAADELAAADPFDSLTELQRHAEEMAATPSEWMPWNYRATLAVLAAAD